MASSPDPGSTISPAISQSRITPLILTLLVAFGALSTDLYLAGLPAIVEEFSSTPAHGQLSVSIFMLGFALGQLVYGPYSDYYGRLSLLKPGLIFYVLASLLCWWAASMDMFLVARLLQGIAAASGPVIARAIVVDIYKRDEAVRVMGYLASAMAIIPAIAPILGSVLLNWFSWHSHFVAMAFFAAIALLAALLVLTETSPSIGKRKVSAGNMLTQFPQHLRDPQFAGYVLVSSSIFAGMFAFISNSSFLVIEIMAVPAAQFGFVFSVMVLGYMMGALSGARLVSRLGQQGCMRLGLGIAVASATLLLGYSLFTAAPTLLFMLPLTVYAFAAGIVLPNSQASALTLFPGSAGGASSVYGFISILIAAGTGVLVGHLYNGTAIPIAASVFFGSVLALLFFLFMVRATAAAPVRVEDKAAGS